MSIMILLPRHRWLLCLAGVACLIVSTEVRAQSHDDAKRRAFAEVLARRAKAERAEGTRERAAANHRLAHVSPLAAANHHLARVSPLAANVAGLPPASPTAPSGFGFGRDAFVQGLYPEILGRDASQSEVDYWARKLVLGLPPQTVADRIWFSPEHRAEVANGTAPGIPLKKAYRTAFAFGQANKLGPVK
jgi:hypothetical protein